MTKAVDSHVFMVLFRIAGAVEPDEYAIRVYDDARMQDVMLGGPDESGVFEIEFERAAPSFSEAVLSALADVNRVLPEAELLRVEPDDLATIAGIASRLNRSHESVRLLMHGKRGPGGFPKPAGHLDKKTQVWRWHEVSQWFEQAMGISVPAGEHAAFLAAVNDVLELRRIAPQAITRPQTARQLAALLPRELTPAA